MVFWLVFTLNLIQPTVTGEEEVSVEGFSRSFWVAMPVGIVLIFLKCERIHLTAVMPLLGRWSWIVQESA